MKRRAIQGTLSSDDLGGYNPMRETPDRPTTKSTPIPAQKRV